jgi:hypothetical protein
MDVLQTLKKDYIKDRKKTLNHSYLTLRGFFHRLRNTEAYWDDLDNQESRLLVRAGSLLSDLLAAQPKTEAELKNYQWILKNTNTKFTERGNFLLAVLTIISTVGLAKLNEIFGWVDGVWSVKLAFSITLITLIISITDAVRLRSRIAIHDELVNIIEKQIQTPSVFSEKPDSKATDKALIAQSPSLGMRRLAIIISKDTYNGLFKAATVILGVALIGMSQTGPILYDKEVEAYSAKFKIEETINRPLADINCELLTTVKADCKTAKHKTELSRVALNLFDTIVKDAMRLGAVLLLFGVLVFFATPFVHETDDKNSTP